MSTRWRSRWNAGHRAAWLALGLAAAAAPGCQRLVNRRPLAPTPPPMLGRSPVRETGAKVPQLAAAVPTALPALPPDPVPAPANAPESPASEFVFVSHSSGTPLLDAALARANGTVVPKSERRADAESVDPPPAKPRPAPPPKPVASEPKKDAPEPPRTAANGDEPPKAKAKEAPPTPSGKPIRADDPPADVWRDGLSRLRAEARRRAGQAEDDDGSWRLRARVLDWLAGESLAPGHADAWHAVLGPLATATAPETPDDALLAEDLAGAVDTLDALAPFRAVGLQLCRKVDGFGVVTPVESERLRPGKSVLVYCELEGVHPTADPDGFRSRVASRVELTPRGGGEPAWSKDLGTSEDLCRRRRRDFYVNYRVAFPPTLPPGAYTLRVTLTDLNGGRTAEATQAVDVRP